MLCINHEFFFSFCEDYRDAREEDAQEKDTRDDAASDASNTYEV